MVSLFPRSLVLAGEKTTREAPDQAYFYSSLSGRYNQKGRSVRNGI